MDERKKVVLCESQGQWEIHCHAGGGRVLLVRERFRTREDAEVFLAKARASLGGSVAGRWYQKDPDGQINNFGNGYFTLGRPFDSRDNSLTAVPFPPAQPFEVFREMGKRGGDAAAAVMREVKDHAVKIAQERAPAGGWKSAPLAAAEIMVDLRAFAREHNRNPSQRKVEEWLREAGIKKGAHTQ